MSPALKTVWYYKTKIEFFSIGRYYFETFHTKITSGGAPYAPAIHWERG